jgi:Flp pilus assembly protein TadG
MSWNSDGETGTEIERAISRMQKECGTMRWKSFKGNEKGSTAVEFAILLPLLLLIIFGGIEYGLVMFNQQVITNASREAARAGIVVGSDSVDDPAVLQIALDYCQDYLVTFETPAPLPTVTIARDAGNSTEFGHPLIVTVQFNYQFLLLPNLSSLFGGSFSSTLPLEAKTTMRHE